MVSQDYIMDKLNEFVKSDKGKKCLKKNGIRNGVTKQDAKRITKSLYTRLVSSSMKITKANTSLFPSQILVQFSEPQSGKDGSYSVYINFDAGSFYRESLVSTKTGTFIGVGAYDIVGLFTQGYISNKYVRGLWRATGNIVTSHSISKGHPGLKANNFVDKTIDDFIKTYEKKYKIKIRVTYPSRWHSK